jgi:hypothetical protein
MDKNKNYTDRELLLLNIQSTEEITKRLDKFEHVFVTKTESAALKHEIEELRKEVQELQSKKVFRDTVLWVGLTASAIINIIALYNIFTRR